MPFLRSVPQSKTGADEGFELAKTILCLKGHKLYSEVWNDQPPLHTWIVTKIIELSRRFSHSASESKGENPNKGVTFVRGAALRARQLMCDESVQTRRR